MQGLVQPGLDAFLRQAQLVVRKADVPDLALLFRLQHAFVHSRPVTRLIADVRYMELVNVDVVRLQGR